MATFLPSRRHPHVCKGVPLVVYKQSPKQCDKEAVTSDQVVYITSCQGLCTHNEWLYPEFQFTATNFMSMAVKLSDLVDKTSEANLQADGQTEKPAQEAADLQEMEEEDSSPLHLLTWSPVQRLSLGCLNMKHCLEIRVALTDELGDMPPPSHSWTALLVEDMLRKARTGLTEAVVTSPGRAIFFYGRCSMGEGLKADEAMDAAFLLTGAGTWVGKISLPHCWPNDNTRGQKGHCPSCVG